MQQEAEKEYAEPDRVRLVGLKEQSRCSCFLQISLKMWDTVLKDSNYKAKRKMELQAAFKDPTVLCRQVRKADNFLRTPVLLCISGYVQTS